MKKTAALIILDGYGIAEPGAGNAIAAAKTPVMDRLLSQCPNSKLVASGEYVGLPMGQMGNSEVGHTNIGAGRVVYQDFMKIFRSISEGDFFENEAYIGAVEHALETDGALHVLGLLSNGGVHSHISHFEYLIKLAHDRGLDRIYLHCFMDGRDVSPVSGSEFIAETKDFCREIGAGKIATVMGRFYAMDRDNRWERVEKAYAAMVYGKGAEHSDPEKAIKKSYDKGVTDEFIAPIICNKDGLIKSGDSIVFINFRADRAREITRAFVAPETTGIENINKDLDVYFVCTTEYDATIPNVKVAYPPEQLTDILGEVFAKNGLTQLRIAETEKYAHVTFFFNGGTETVFEGEDRCLIPSPKEFPTYDLIPEMSAYKVAEETVSRIESGKYDAIILNFANCDMVGHTGDFRAAVKAVETVDICLGKVLEAIEKNGGFALVTADHGNSEKMSENNGAIFTAHTTNLVPFVVVGKDVKVKNGILADVAPTMLELMGVEQPAKMTGKSLIVK